MVGARNGEFRWRFSIDWLSARDFRVISSNVRHLIPGAVCHHQPTWPGDFVEHNGDITPAITMFIQYRSREYASTTVRMIDSQQVSEDNPWAYRHSTQPNAARAGRSETLLYVDAKVNPG